VARDWAHRAALVMCQPHPGRFEADGSSGKSATTRGCKAKVLAGEHAHLGPDPHGRRGDLQGIADQRARMTPMRGRLRRIEGAPDYCW
jgi:hypothetical protein